MKILFLAPRLPLPADTGGKIRTLNILKQITKIAQVTFLSFSFENEDNAQAKELERLGVKVQTIPIDEPSTIQKILGVAFYLIPFSMAKYRSVQLEKKISELLKSTSFDAVHIDHLHMSHYMDMCKGIPCIIDEHNVEYKILERYISVENSLLKKLVFWDQSLKMRVFEARQIQKTNACLACSTDDQKILESISKDKTPIYVVPNGVDTQFFTLDPANPREEAMVFTGSMDWLPNDDAITYFCAEILPLIWAHNPAIKLYVVGKSPSKSVQQLAQKDNRVVVTGRVDDVRPYVHRSKVFIVPLRVGGGTRLKILEAMAMGKPVVSTSIGAEGIQYSHDHSILIGNTPEEFSNRVLELFKDPSKALQIGAQGRQLVCTTYDWNIVGQQLKTIYQKVGHDHKK